MELKLTSSPGTLKEQFLALRSTEDIAGLLEVKYADLVYWIYRTPESQRYKPFQIRKKSGAPRQIEAPSRNIKILQQKLNQVLQAVYQPKPCVHGFVSGRSVMTNAEQHVKRKYLLNVDLLDFFPSINFGRVRGMFMAKPYNLPQKVATFLAHLCCFRRQLPQGAPTSPVVSNMICARMDSEIQRLAAAHRCNYTRYADDMSFSTSRRDFPSAIAVVNELHQVEPGAELRKIVDSNGFSVHPKKIWLRKADRRQEVTGITVNDILNLPRKFTNQIRAMLHAWEKYGLEAASVHFAQNHDLKHRSPWTQNPAFQRVVKGRIEYLGMIKGHESSTYLRFLDRLGRLAPNLTGGRGTPRELLLRRYNTLMASDDPRGRGYLLQDLLRDTLALFGIQARKSFMRNSSGEQIDGAFLLDGWHYLVECRWRQKVADGRQVDGLLAQVLRSGDQTMGLYLAINGWSENVPGLVKQNPCKRIILMDGEDLQTILEGKITMAELLQGKREELNLRSEPFISAEELIRQRTS